MRYEIAHGRDLHDVEIKEIGNQTYEISVDGAEPVRVDAFKNARTVYSILIGARQFEGSVDELEDGTLDVHVGTSAFDFTAIDERKKMLVGVGLGGASGKQEIRAQMPGKIVKLLVNVGDEVSLDQGLLIIEAMKMENELKSPIDGVVSQVEVQEADTVENDALLVVVEPPEDH